MTKNISELLTDQSQLSAQRSYEIALEYRQDLIDVSHVFLALLDYPDEILLQVFERLALDIERLKTETFSVIKLQRRVPFWKGKKYKMYVTPLVKQSIDNAIVLSKGLNKERASSAHIFWGVIHSSMKNDKNPYEVQYRMCQIFSNSNITSEKVLNAIREINHYANDEVKD